MGGEEDEEAEERTRERGREGDGEKRHVWGGEMRWGKREGELEEDEKKGG